MELFKTVVELIKGLAWPLLIIWLVIMFRHPVRQILQQIPGKLSHATKVSVGSLTVEIQARAAQAGFPDIADRLAKLSRGALEEILKLDRTGGHGLIGYRAHEGSENYMLPVEKRLNIFRELEAVGFLEFIEPLDIYLNFIKTLPLKRVSDYLGRTHDEFHPLRPLTEEETTRIKSQMYTFTDMGRQAVYTIIQVVVDQIATSSDGEKKEPPTSKD